MEKKRKLPARSARVENANKRRNVTPRADRSVTPPPPPEPVVKEPSPTPPPPLPTSLQPGQPLPTIETPQPGDLPIKEYQSISERHFTLHSGVLAESLSRSRYRWINDGLFEKFWTKPHKRKGVLNEDPKNPPKDSMTRVGNVTITIEPHIIEATMYVVKESKQLSQPQVQAQPPQPQSQPQPLARPVLQYGPPNGSMPPPPTPGSAASTPIPTAATTPKPLAAPSPSQRPSTSSTSVSGIQPTPSPLTTINVATSPSPSPAPSAQPAALPPAPTPSLPAAAAPPPPIRPPTNPLPGQQPAYTGTPLARPPPPPPPSTTTAPHNRPANAGPAQSPAGVKPAAPVAGRPPAKPVPNDPVIALLAQKASGDPELRDLMKRVAVGQAKQGELDRFQKIIDQLNAEYRRSGGQQGPSADRLLVDGRTVKYFADEVRTILDIVLASNPRQRSSELRPPPRSDPLVVLLVKAALEDQKTSDMIRRIAEGRPGFTDATDLKEILDRLHRDAKPPPQASPAPPPAKQPPSDAPNGHMRVSNPPTPQQANPQALRSKGPPPAPKPDISAVVFDFGTGDRYLFPKFSILEYLPSSSGQEVVASFLIVRKGSTSEYGGDPKLDYYQPVTIRISTQTGRILENLMRVVAPQDEVRRYMDDVMDNMTRAEYVLLAMHLPRASKEEKANGVLEEPKTNGSTPKVETDSEQTVEVKPSVLWTKSTNSTKQLEFLKPPDPEEENEAKYKRLIQSVTAKEVRD
ncbi:hypothetical protein BBK36DRAFT_1191931 [Trichoderma citrinoviride]|uniref:SWR1-complex protein 3 domain-containing protein n=1 Tax=Trichoderma citrinoviride TaxID=58853 RepID=A0A2T4BHP5_9HYPO|nr:hypothetical protein BBK36DRAFT_1191931 [Trichoderma citrinoviride]PTB68781.1 hypothetical protein BBK36DRAFT_1191931 [Trichoderma citrinoviride]